eukprot:TRINITY_DN18334_c0_g1_i1.p1 TRINITY_DN18334_c0_g1~~TRINITY_DN18334_c0_g1_i1.p1  ORF type:complete len:742 (+),score=168.45 TRINITY_DN18334_c0_g1_i1:25-2226(+)
MSVGNRLCHRLVASTVPRQQVLPWTLLRNRIQVLRAGSRSLSVQAGAAPDTLDSEKPLVPERISASALRQAIETAKLLPRGKAETVKQHRLLVESFEAAVPELLKSGDCLKLCLTLPLSVSAERLLKRLLLLLSRRLRRDERFSSPELPPAELIRVPSLLTRLNVQDETFFEDFCAACARCWQELTPTEMATLFRGVEAYTLLHPSKGTALNRLVATFESSLGGSGEAAAAGVLPSAPPAALAALCHGALAPKMRSACVPLLAQLRIALQALVESSKTGEALSVPDSLELLGAAGELHKAFGVTDDALKGLLERSQEVLFGDSSKAEISSGHLSLAARACGRLGYALPQESNKLFEVLLTHLASVEAAKLEPVLQACRQLPSSMRRRVADELILKGNNFQKGREQSLMLRLQLLHDLPLQAAAIENKEDCAALSAAVKDFVEELLNCEQVSAASLCAAYLASNSAQHSLSISGSGEVVEELGRLSTKVLDALERHWPELGPLEVQSLFRSPADPSQVVARASKHVSNMKDFRALSALHQAAVAASAKKLSAATQAALQKVAGQLKNPKELSSLEASLRRGPTPHEESSFKSLLSGVRDNMFRSQLKQEPAWNKSPGRGYIRYVEQCLERDRNPSSLAIVSETETQAISKKEVASAASSDLVNAEGLPQSGIKGVTWHSGVEGWEVKLEVRGQHVLGGYFKASPKDPNSMDIALAQAARCREELEMKHYNRVTE